MFTYMIIYSALINSKYTPFSLALSPMIYSLHNLQFPFSLFPRPLFPPFSVMLNLIQHLIFCFYNSLSVVSFPFLGLFPRPRRERIEARVPMVLPLREYQRQWEGSILKVVSEMRRCYIIICRKTEEKMVNKKQRTDVNCPHNTGGAI